MKKVEISGVAKVCAFVDAEEIDGDYARVLVNGVELDSLLTTHMLEKKITKGCSYIDEVAICKVSITIEPFTELILSVNDEGIPLEL